MRDITQTFSSPSEEILTLYREHGSIHYGERCSVNSHSFQAGIIAREKGLSEDMILAAFLHDIGHLLPLTHEQYQAESMGGFGMEQHDKIGELYLAERGFSDLIQATVRNHVDAKRYLAFAEEGYLDKISSASMETMKYQGGIMKKDEAREFEKKPFFKESIQIRKIGEEAKGIGFEIKEEYWGYFEDLLERYVNP